MVSASGVDRAARGADAPSCLFCEIVRGERPATRVVETGACVAFLDTRPLFPGHVLVVPRLHVVTLPELAPEQIEPLFGLVRRLAGAVERGLEADGSFVALNNRVSQSVPHLHVHVVPRRAKDGLKGFFWPRTKYADTSDAEAVAARIRAALEPAA
ncbi:MAG TPA: HIT family protein [Polyangiaceae bacterium]|jgi:histidine triad (HIT) family protein